MKYKVLQFMPYIGKEEYKATKECFDTTWITEGSKAQKFNKKLKKFLNVKYGVFASNGTLALYLGLKALGITRGDEVIVPDCTFIASANAVQMAGATAVFVDVNRENFQIDVNDCRRVLSKRTKAIMPVHLYGMAANMTNVLEFANKHNLFVIEDAAEVLGVKYKGKYCGTFGEVGCFSFFADKTITTGEGGFVVTNKKRIHQRLLYLRNQGRISRGTFIHPRIGYNFRMTDIQMAMGLAQLKKLKVIAQKKINIDKLYKSYLECVQEIIFTAIEPGSDYIPFRTTILCKSAHRLMKFMSSKGIQTRTFFYPLHKQPCFKHLNQNDDKYFPNAIYAYKHGVCLPTFAGLKKQQVKYVCNAIKEFYCGKH